MKNIFTILVVLNFIVLSCAGCPKLVRERKKKKDDIPVYYFEDDKSVYRNLDAYEDSYMFWRVSKTALYV